MPKITFVAPDGTWHAVDAEVGDSVMNAAGQNGVAGIVAECGGHCSCATCPRVGACGFRGRGGHAG